MICWTLVLSYAPDNLQVCKSLQHVILIFTDIFLQRYSSLRDAIYLLNSIFFCVCLSCLCLHFHTLFSPSKSHRICLFFFLLITELKNIISNSVFELISLLFFFLHNLNHYYKCIICVLNLLGHFLCVCFTPEEHKHTRKAGL